MSKTVVCLIDTNQFFSNPQVLDYAINMGYEVYVPSAVLSELDKVHNQEGKGDNFLEYAKKYHDAFETLERNKSKYKYAKSLTSDSSNFVDPKILQWVLEFMGERRIQEIIVYTEDKKLTDDINKRIATLTCITHNSKVSAEKFIKETTQDVKTTQSDKKPKNKSCTPKKNVSDEKKKITVITKPDGMFIWRDDNYLADKSGYGFAYTNYDIEKLKGEKALRVWHKNALRGDWIKVYTDLPIKKGSHVSIEFIIFDNSCDIFAGLELWLNGTKKQPSEFTRVKEGKWCKISMIADDYYDDVNFAVKAINNCTSGHESINIFIKNFTITE